MTTRSKQEHPVDIHSKNVIENAVYYYVVFFQPGSSIRQYKTFEDLKIAKAYTMATLKEPNRLRSAMIYAIDESDQHALVGTMNRDLVWKETKN